MGGIKCYTSSSSTRLGMLSLISYIVLTHYKVM